LNIHFAAPKRPAWRNRRSKIDPDSDLRTAKLAEIRIMSPEVHTEIDELRRRVKRLEEAAGRTRRGRTNQRGAALYLGKSREWLRQLHLRGEGPRRAPDGSYSYDDLDSFAERGAA
jgi:hypothetical protein